MNHVIPALMFLRSYVLQHSIDIKFFTLDANSISMIDNTDPSLQLGTPPLNGRRLKFKKATNQQSSRQTIRDFVNKAIEAT